MKIVHIVLGKANPERMNGVNKVVHQLATTMREKGLDVEVWGITATPDDKTTPRTYPLHLFAGSGRNFAVDPRLKEAIEALPPQTCVHLHGVFIPIFYAIARLLKKQKIAWVVMPHGACMPDSVKKNRLIKWMFFLLFDSWIFKHARCVHVNTPLEKAAIEKMSGLRHVTVFFNGYALPSSGITKNSAGLYQKGRPIIGFVGRLDQRHKGLDILLAGFHLYLGRGGSGVLWLVGDGPHRSILENTVQKWNMADRVRFWGSRFGQEKEDILKSMDVFVHTSRWEGMPMSVLEAAAHELPLIVSSGTGLMEMTEKYQAGFPLNENTPEKVCQAFLDAGHALRAGTLTRTGKRAKEMLSHEFDWKKIVEKMIHDVYFPARKTIDAAA